MNANKIKYEKGKIITKAAKSGNNMFIVVLIGEKAEENTMQYKKINTSLTNPTNIPYIKNDRKLSDKKFPFNAPHKYPHSIKKGTEKENPKLPRQSSKNPPAIPVTAPNFLSNRKPIAQEKLKTNAGVAPKNLGIFI